MKNRQKPRRDENQEQRADQLRLEEKHVGDGPDGRAEILRAGDHVGGQQPAEEGQHRFGLLLQEPPRREDDD